MIGLIGLTLGLYRQSVPALIKRLEKFQRGILKILQARAIISSFGPISEKSELERAFRELEQQDIAGLVVVLLSYSPSLLSLPFLKKFKGPILIWNTQKLKEIKKDFGLEELLDNHGMHGAQDLASVLCREGRSFSFITGHYADRAVQSQVDNWLEVALAVKKLGKTRIGQVGGSFPLMGDFLISPFELKHQLGPEVITITLKEIATTAKGIKDSEITGIIKEDLKKFKASSELSVDAHRRSIRLELALRKIIAKEKLNGLALNFQAINQRCPLETIPFYAISKLISEGLGYGGEGDTLTATSVLLLQYLTGQANFVEMFTMDFKNNLILMNHMAESNPAMARKDRPIYIKENLLQFNRCKPAAVLFFTMRPGIATLLNFAINTEKKIKMIMARVEVIDKPPLKEIDSPHFFIKPSNRIENFLTRYSLEGGTHHLALAYGDQRQKIKMASEILQLPLAEI